MSEWIEWKGGKRPCGLGTTVEYRMRDGQISSGWGGEVRWTHLNNECDIIAYRIIKEGEE